MTTSVENMTDSEAIAAVRAGKRAVTKYSVTGDVRTGCQHPRGWRTVACDGDADVVECPDCGAQRISRCNFDQEYA